MHLLALLGGGSVISSNCIKITGDTLPATFRLLKCFYYLPLFVLSHVPSIISCEISTALSYGDTCTNVAIRTCIAYYTTNCYTILKKACFFIITVERHNDWLRAHDDYILKYVSSL